LRIGGLPDVQTKKYKVARMAAMLQVWHDSVGLGPGSFLSCCKETSPSPKRRQHHRFYGH
jgi:hypothetical protein